MDKMDKKEVLTRKVGVKIAVRLLWLEQHRGCRITILERR